MVTWPGEPAPRIEPLKRIAHGDSNNVSIITLGDHTGTHVDPPLHFIDSSEGRPVLTGLLQPSHLIVLLVVLLLVLGPKRLPEAGRAVGRGLREFKDSVAGRDEGKEGSDEARHEQAAALDAGGSEATPATRPR